jgi:tartrate-resistant acid phosphatase type 5
MEKIVFITTGDWGMSTLLHQQNKNNLFKQKDVQFNVLLGDNFYPAGVKSVKDPQWEYMYKTTFPTNIPSFAILGNHDYIENPNAQIMYSQIEPSWKMPFYYYDMLIHLSENETAHFIFLDTCLLAEDITTNLIRHTSSASVPLYLNLVKKFQNKQKQWFEKVLKTSTSKWKIVFGHYPVFSNGPHQISKGLQEYLAPLFMQYKVDFYVSGHDHNLQHLMKQNTNYVIAGGFSTYSPKNKVCYEHLGSRFQAGQGGFVKFKIQSKEVRMQFIGNNNRIIYDYSCSKL